MKKVATLISGVVCACLICLLWIPLNLFGQEVRVPLKQEPDRVKAELFALTDSALARARAGEAPLLAPVVRTVHAQASDCTYDRCALRLQAGIFSTRIVQGADAIKVGRVGGFFGSTIEPLSTAGDSARSHYEAYLTHYNRGGALALVSLVASAASLIVLLSSISSIDIGSPGSGSSPGASLALLGAAAPLTIGSLIELRKGFNHPEQAIWFYNRSLCTGR